MDNIKRFEKVKEEFENLEYKDKLKLDKLSRQLVMLIENILPEKPQYATDFQLLDFRINSAFMNDNDQRIRWALDRQKTINLIDVIVEELEYFPKKAEVKELNQIHEIADSSKVFIVHGHDNEAKTEVARFIERLGLEAIILHEQINSGATIIEKLEKYTDVGFAIVLYTPDDIGAVKTESDNSNPRARQNVVFEHGLLIGKIGRNNVVALVKDTVEIPNDISGVVYETMDSKGAWKYKIAREMKSSGYDVDMNKIG
ncbi:MAG: nucleotide-binding protein [Psychrobacter sp.]|nr:nucleotide-binding protein [Psychrobacter sp.]